MMFEDYTSYEDLGVKGVVMPSIPIDKKYKDELNLPEECPSDEFLKKLTYEGLKRRNLFKDDYIKRADHELNVLKELLYVDYILAVWDICNFADVNGIPRGAGRGSCAGSIVLYAIGVTEVDSVKYNLYFERFVSKARAKTTKIDGIVYFDGSLLCDIDLDFEYTRRAEVLQYIEKKYPSRTAKILTVNTMAGKACFKDVMKIVGFYSEDDANEISDSIPKLFGQVRPLKDAVNDSEKFKDFCDKNIEVFEIAKKIENLKKNYSVHPSGVAISHAPIKNIMPTQLTGDGELITGIDMKWTAEIAVKFDILGLRTLTVVDECCKMVGIKMLDINPESPIIYQALQELDCPKGIFQIEAESQYRACKQLKPSNIAELSDLMAICRPGASDYIQQYVDVKNDPSLLPKIEPTLDKLLSETKGVLLYQELLMSVGNKVFGLSLEDAEILRRIVGKKLVKEMGEWKPKIYELASKKGLQESVADFYWKALSDSANYSFNKSHSLAYATLSAITTYLKFKHPKEFFCSLLNCCKFEQNPREEIEKICGELDYFGIKLLPPSLISSKENFSIEGNDIRYGLSSIKGVSEKTIQKLLDFRGHKAENKYELFLIAKDSGLNIGLLSSLIQSGCLDGYGEERCKMVLEAQAFNILTDREKRIVKNLGAKYNYDLLQTISDCYKLKLVVDGEKPLFNEKRWETFYKKYSSYKEIYKKNHTYKLFANWFFERSLLGYTYSCNLKDCFSFSKDFTQIKDLKFTPDKDRVSIICIVSDLIKGKGRESGNKYIKLTIQDESGTFAAMCVESKNNKKAEKMLEDLSKISKESIITLSGQKTQDVIFIDKAEILNEKIYMKMSQLKD